MTKVTIFKNKKDEYVGFLADGHAGYADAGDDIVCAAISVLTINTVNSVEQFTSDRFGYDADEDSGRMEFHLQEDAGKESLLLMSSLVLGLQGVQSSYGNDYLTLDFKEV